MKKENQKQSMEYLEEVTVNKAIIKLLPVIRNRTNSKLAIETELKQVLKNVYENGYWDGIEAVIKKRKNYEQRNQTKK